MVLSDEVLETNLDDVIIVLFKFEQIKRLQEELHTHLEKQTKPQIVLVVDTFALKYTGDPYFSFFNQYFKMLEGESICGCKKIQVELYLSELKSQIDIPENKEVLTKIRTQILQTIRDRKEKGIIKT